MSKVIKDRRYTIRQEFCGRKARWAVRFCGQIVDLATSRDEAQRLMREYVSEQWADQINAQISHRAQ